MFIERGKMVHPWSERTRSEGRSDGTGTDGDAVHVEKDE